MKRLLDILNIIIWVIAIAQAIAIVSIAREYESLRAMNKAVNTIWIYPKTVEASEDVQVISDLKCLEIQHFEKDSANLILIRYRK